MDFSSSTPRHDGSNNEANGNINYLDAPFLDHMQRSSSYFDAASQYSMSKYYYGPGTVPNKMMTNFEITSEQKNFNNEFNSFNPENKLNLSVEPP